MVKLITYRCDRCKKKFDVREGEKPNQYIYKAHYANDPDENIDLCVDCDSTLNVAFAKIKAFDELADKISEDDPIE